MREDLEKIYDEILSDPDLHKVFYMREQNSSEEFDAEKALETARKSNFWEVIKRLPLEELYS
ncbi:MAG: hypothetical protein HQK65_07500 [Desulfamplus sp.]|nr:hypothetical protein [Desulfamplus sp.]